MNERPIRTPELKNARVQRLATSDVLGEAHIFKGTRVHVSMRRHGLHSASPKEGWKRNSIVGLI